MIIIVATTAKYAYVINTLGSSVSQYSIGSNGELNPMLPATVATA